MIAKIKKCCKTCCYCDEQYGIVHFEPPIMGLCSWDGQTPEWLRTPNAAILVRLDAGARCDVWEAKIEATDA
jgi:hypothetical protein